MLGSFDECKGSASLIQSLLHSLPMTAKIVHETFLLYLVIFFIDHKNTTNSLTTTYTNTQKSSTTQENGLETKLQPSKKGFLSRKSAFFSTPPPQIPSKHRCRAVLDCHSRLHCVRFFRRKTRLFGGATLLLLSARRL